MAGKGNLENLKSWKPGQSGNPAGRAGVLPPEVRSARKKNQARLIKLVAEVFGLTDVQIQDRTENPETDQLERSIIAMTAKCREGDVTAFRYLMELMVGKIPENDYDGFTEEEVMILNRVKEIFSGQEKSGAPGGDAMGQSH